METITTVTRRVDRIESALISLIEQVDRTSKRVDQLSVEMAEFKDEMAEFKDEMAEFKDEMRKDRKEMNVKMGHLANRLGTMVEDMVLPSIGRVLKQVVECEGEPSASTVRTRRQSDDGRSQEYDGVVVCGGYLLICDAKSRLEVRDIERFTRLLAEARDFLPEYAHLKIIGAMGTLYIDKSLVVKGEREGLIMLGVGEQLMEILNKDGFVPRTF